MGRSARSLLFILILALVVWLVWSRVRVILFVPVSPLGLVALVLVTTVVVFLLLDHLFSRMFRR